MTEIEAREKFRKMVEDTHLVVCGNPELKIPGMIEKHDETTSKLDTMDEKLDRDHALLLPNRALFGIWKVIKNPVIILLSFSLLASLFGGDAIGYIKTILRIGK